MFFFNLVIAASTAPRSLAQWLQSRLLHCSILIWDRPAPELITFSPSLPACSSAPSAVTIVLAVIGSVVLIGIILLGLWKLLVTIHDRREFDRFQSERSRARYEMVSSGWRCCWGTGGLSGRSCSKQLCSDGEGWQAQGMRMPVPCGATQQGFRDRHICTVLLLASYKYSAKFGFIMYFQSVLKGRRRWGSRDQALTMAAARSVRSMRDTFQEALGGVAQYLMASPVPADWPEDGSDGRTMEKQHCFCI